MFKNIIWDFDGTLYDTYPIMLDSMMQSLKNDFLIEGDRDRIYYLLKSESSKAVAKEYGLDFDVFTTAFKKIEKQDTRTAKPFENTKMVLEAIMRQTGQNYILTHRTYRSTKEMLVQDCLDPFFTEIVGSDHPFPRKPNPSSLHYFINKYALNPRETVMIGDRKLDIDAGKNAGVATIFFDVEDILFNIDADFRVNSMVDLLKRIQNGAS